ncbi:class I SAM-dependent methyltransferase [Paenibacillus sp. FSL M8-0228]|uniref:SAM-dependent methyltransferase n=2 Tax=Paenibacillus TaxID=44249 RepID=E3E8M9_PAEPS|nr:class I SAM-dependent methyltransferase [Paenibacillus polymyxa]ADO57738.1 SAM-dependent methyltransferase [Paenibacillus polymyxa SC2]MBO3286222.1 class I SAM-dependent methyltransferase [Paenibacillus polymyxa]ODB58093.1 SAM-dependent methyltransferase [Paenibacillus polymyxa]WPQ55479.1 class I SAM-dependent methyltransferase [Paenibacillus polymyxa]CCI70373.1 3-demethylubiquinone-9 3-methyltransferase [Paenibacillus polymyxa M1]
MELFRQVPLYRFLALCNESGMERTVLDCGAGGDSPPLSLFVHYGYKTIGIEMNVEQFQKANRFAEMRGQNLNIQHGDMRSLSFSDESISFVYSYNSVFHMRKEDVKQSINEMKRVLKPNGVLFVNFLTVKDFRVGEGVDLGDNQYEQIEDNEPVIHSYYDYNEADAMFDDMKLIYKEDRVLERIYEGKKIRQGFIDYILKK